MKTNKGVWLVDDLSWVGELSEGGSWEQEQGHIISKETSPFNTFWVLSWEPGMFAQCQDRALESRRLLGLPHRDKGTPGTETLEGGGSWRVIPGL